MRAKGLHGKFFNRQVAENQKIQQPARQMFVLVVRSASGPHCHTVREPKKTTI